MKLRFRTLSAGLVLAGLLPLQIDAAPKKVLVVTATKGYRHSSIPTAENVLTTLGETSGDFTVVDVVRGGPNGTNDAEVAEKMSLEKLKNVDAVIFANTTGDLAIPDKDGFIRWIEAGHALIGMHSGSDTFHGFPAYTKALGGEFKTHGAQVQIDAYNLDPSHPATKSLGPIYTVFDEIYQFQNFKREEVHGLLTLDKHPNTLVPGDYPVAWCKTVGNGKVFYTSLGHREDVWTSEAYQKHILGGLRWSLGLEAGSSTPQDNANALSSEENAAGFKLLFDGKSLDGWTYRRPDGNKSWSVQRGILCNVLAPNAHGTDIYSTTKYRDFIVRYEYQVPPGSNSGFYLRGRYEIQIFDNSNKDGQDKGLNGDIYNVASCALPATRKAGQWQQVEARMIGNKITVILNGVKVHENVVVDHGTGSHLDDNVNDPGPILLQGDHGSVAFRNVRIKTLN